MATSDDGSHEGRLFKELETFKVGTGHLHVKRMCFLFGRDGIISPENLRELVFPVVSEVDGWMSCSHELFGGDSRLEMVTLDCRGTHKNVDRSSNLSSLKISPPNPISVISVPSPLRPLSICGPIRDSEGSGRQEYQGGCGGYGGYGHMYIRLDKEDAGYGYSFTKSAIIGNASSVMGDEGVRAAWMRLLRMNVAVRMEGECPETTLGVSRECEDRARGEERDVL
ncbi:hypothetical protein EDD18DRAFT_1336328 [Armillaria luteobubalina]|uniref:Uncharacterized protein n=1 Tax=Armillaria luteobubalina TaxID=153913 RepID=A0AA39PGZ4_9AGAR|nr:hypothetical protein EDD18DRAFT_1336328 [Armillaria luteobubalina]